MQLFFLYLKQIIAFETDNGKEPFTDWFDSLKDKGLKAKIMIRLDRLRNNNYGDHRRLNNGLVELKEKIGGALRIYFGEDGTKIVILLLGGNKSSQEKDIKKAQEYWEKYKNRRNLK